MPGIFISDGESKLLICNFLYYFDKNLVWNGLNQGTVTVGILQMSMMGFD